MRLGEEDSLPLLIGSGDVQTDQNKKKSEGSMGFGEHSSKYKLRDSTGAPAE